MKYSGLDLHSKQRGDGQSNLAVPITVNAQIDLLENLL